MLFITDFADQAVMLPMALVMLLALCVLGWWRGALVWAAAACFTFGLVFLMKAGFVALSAEFGSDYQLSPSGHVASACIVYGGLAVLMLRGAVPGLLVAAVPVTAAIVFGYTRLSLGMHSPAEVVIGAIVGLAGVKMLALTVGERPRLTAWPLTLAGGVTALAMHGLHMPAEQAIHSLSSGW